MMVKNTKENWKLVFKMFNKKGGIAVEELRGALTYMIVFAIALLFFYGCNISHLREDKETFEFSRDKLYAIKTLNSFLQEPVEEENVADLIKDSYLNNDYDKFTDISKDYFSDLDIDGRIIIYSERGRLLYDSFDFLTQVPYTKPILNKISTKIPVIEREPELLTIVLEIREKTDENEE